ncbi:MAG: nitroreductase family protein [Treponema sp.]|jgi:nitroreductase|nr:nitroreductase family protein [Treponema sp.]
MSAIFERRSVRKFLPKPVEQEKIERILRAGFQAPTAGNRRPWEFLVITEQKIKDDLVALVPRAKLLAQAPALIVTLGNPGEGKMPGDDLWWVEDCSAAVENMLLQIVDEGLGGVWVGWYPDPEKVPPFSEYFKLPANMVGFAIIALGYAEEQPPKLDRFEPAKVHYQRYSS